MKIAIVGAGRVATALAVRWKERGHVLTGVVAGRTDATRERIATHLADVPAVDDPLAALASLDGDGLLILGVPDDQIAGTDAALAAALHAAADDASTPHAAVAHAGLHRITVVHLSGALGLDVLHATTDLGAQPLCLHPLQTFPTVAAALERLDGSTPFAVTANGPETTALGIGVAADAGGDPFLLTEPHKALYHAAAVLASNALVAILDAAHEAMAAAGVADAAKVLAPLERASFDNALALGPAGAITGPASRGDATTIARNLEALASAAPDLIPLYVAITEQAMRTAGDRLSADDRARVRDILGG